MAESLVNPVSAAQLSPRNQEPTHLSGEHDDLGDATDSKLDYAGKLKTDTSVPRSVPAEPTHLNVKTEDDEEDLEVVENDEDPKTVDEADDDEVEIEFDGDRKDEDVDDLDKAIDELATLPVTEITVNEAEDDDDDEKKVDEDDDDDEKKVNEAKDDDDEKAVDEDDDDDDDKKVNEAGLDPDDLRPPPGRKNKEDDDGGLDENEDDDKKKVDEDDDEEDLKESLKISIKIPKASLFESAGFNVKQQKKVASALFEGT